MEFIVLSGMNVVALVLWSLYLTQIFCPFQGVQGGPKRLQEPVGAKFPAEGEFIKGTHTHPSQATPSRAMVNGQALIIHEVALLTHTARDAIENHHMGTLSLWLLSTALISLLAGASLYFLAVSPYVIRVIGPLVELH